MSRSLSNAKVLSALVVDGFSNALSLSRRGYAATSKKVGVSNLGRGSGGASKMKEEIVRSTEKQSWVPDPKTGIYRPENGAEEIDVAELRAVLLKKN